jgi:hypothetical protein
MSITGGKGTDSITLGAVTETVFMSTLATNGADTITGFTSGTDKLDVDGTGVAYTQGADSDGDPKAFIDGTSGSKASLATDDFDTNADANEDSTGVIRITDEAATDFSDAVDVIAGAVTISGTAASNADLAIIIDNGSDTRVYNFSDAGDGAALVEADLTLVATLVGLEVADLAIADFIMT